MIFNTFMSNNFIKKFKKIDIKVNKILVEKSRWFYKIKKLVKINSILGVKVY